MTDQIKPTRDEADILRSTGVVMPRHLEPERRDDSHTCLQAAHVPAEKAAAMVTTIRLRRRRSDNLVAWLWIAAFVCVCMVGAWLHGHYG